MMAPKLFTLDESFLDKYRTKTPPFGFNGLGELVYRRTYSRVKDDGINEVWWETVQRVVEGCYRMQQRHIQSHRLSWDHKKAQRSAQEMYDRIFTMKFLPPGRGLWAMGTPLTEERGLQAALFNCSFASTESVRTELTEPFTFLMDASMLGIGVGFDTAGADKLAAQLQIHAPQGDPVTFQIPDSREGWVESLERMLLSYFEPEQPPVVFDYTIIRAEGEPIKGFGGVSSGYKPLERMHDHIRRILEAHTGRTMSVTGLVDIMNVIGKCVVAGNVRRTALIAFGPPTDEYLDLKNATVNPERNHPTDGWGWTSNNSISATLGMDYTEAAQRVALNGEPGFLWLQNIHNYGRMGDKPTTSDNKVRGANPCAEIPLESYELCNLTETFPARHESLEDFQRTLKYAYLYSKTVTLSTTPWPRTNKVMLRNRRIGLSMSGIQQFVAQHGLDTFRQWCETGYATVKEYDQVYSDWLAIPRSKRVTTIKPSGTVSLLAGATPGMHWPEDITYIRRMRLSAKSPLVKALKKAGYPLEPAAGDPMSMVVEVPVKLEEPGLRTLSQVSMWEQLAMAAFLQKYWSDNMVSCTITFDPETEGPQIAAALAHYQYQLKGISFLPRKPMGAYLQMPYEAIDDAEFQRRITALKPLKFGETAEDVLAERFCNNDSCTL